MEKFKKLEDVYDMDFRHRLMEVISGFAPTISELHQHLEKESINVSAPEKLKTQFNVARNMALYSYFLYSLAPEVQLKTYIIVEQALAVKANTVKELSFKQLLGLALKEGWISDAGFRHILNPSPENPWCKSLVKLIPSLRNPLAHNPEMLTGDCLHHISVCADFINQLFPNPICKPLDNDSQRPYANAQADEYRH